MNLVLTGPMGVGKTTVGKMAASALAREFTDTDDVIEQRSGQTISEIFARNGEKHFRELEKSVINDISRKNNIVIATGGGVVSSPENMRALRRSGVIVNLEATLNILLNRLESQNGRPLFTNTNDFKRYLCRRASYYSNSDFRIDTGAMKMEEVVERVCNIARMPFTRICGCISGKNPYSDIRDAIAGGVSMIELRLDLISDPDVHRLVKASAVPVIATDRNDKEHLREAIGAGCEFIDIETDCPERDAIIRLAHDRGCSVIASFHDFEGVPDEFPDKGNADFLKIAVMLNSDEDTQKLVALHGQRDDVIIVGMGPLGVPLRVLSPLLGSFLTYCCIGEKTAPGQLDLQTMKTLYEEIGLR